jgi:hypothetical protein
MTDHTEFINAQKTLGLPNVETSTRCSLRCPQCTRAKLQAPKDSNKYAEIKTRINNGFDLPLEDAEKLLTFFDRGVLLCGQLSDPVLWPDLFAFLEFSKTYPTKNIRIMTAASQKNIQWYKTAFELSHVNVTWVFGVDGMKDTSAIYRVGQNSELLLDAMRLGRSLGLKIEWHYIVFEHNVHQLQEAKEFASTHGIMLNLIKSNRTGGGVTVPLDWKPKRNKEVIYGVI